MRFIPSPTLKHLYSMVVGILLMQWIFASDWIHSFISSLVTYLLCLFFPRKYLGIAVFVWAMGFMTVCHLYRMYVSYMSGIFDFTGTQMVLTMKLTSFAYNLYDGTADKKNVNENNYEGSKAKVLSLSHTLCLSLSVSCRSRTFSSSHLLSSALLAPPPGL
jgi:lysophospholipid acyltransferase